MPGPPGRLRPQVNERVRGRDRDRQWAVPVSRVLYGSDGRVVRHRLTRRF